MSNVKEYPVIKKLTPVGSFLNFNQGKEIYRVESSDGVCYGEKGYSLVCICIHSENPNMIGEEYHFDDRVFRDYNGNNITVEPHFKNSNKK